MQAESPYPCMHYYGALKLPINNDFEYYLFMEYIYGDTLDQWYSKRGTENNPMTMRDISMIIKQILIPLLNHIQFVHQRGIIHRDITAKNILIVETPNYFYPILIDWGVAKIIPSISIKFHKKAIFHKYQFKFDWNS